MDQMLEMRLDHTLPTPTWGALVNALRDDTVEGGKPVAAEMEANCIGGVAERPSLEDILKDIPPKKLNQPCRDDHLSGIALSITEWKSIASFLRLTRAEEENIEKDCGENETQKIGIYALEVERKVWEKGNLRKTCEGVLQVETSRPIAPRTL